MGCEFLWSLTFVALTNRAGTAEMHGVKLDVFNLDFKRGNIGEMCKKRQP